MGKIEISHPTLRCNRWNFSDLLLCRLELCWEVPHPRGIALHHHRTMHSQSACYRTRHTSRRLLVTLHLELAVCLGGRRSAFIPAQSCSPPSMLHPVSDTPRRTLDHRTCHSFGAICQLYSNKSFFEYPSCKTPDAPEAPGALRGRWDAGPAGTSARA